MDKISRFFGFLGQHDALIPYINNLNLEELPNIFQNHPTYWVFTAFSWSKTLEGYNYWAILDNLWLQKCSIL